MADIPVNASDAVTIVAVTVNGQINFDYDFRADLIEDLKAEYRPANGDPVTVLVGGLDFTAVGLGTETGGTITLLAFVTVNGDSMAIYRDITVERNTDYTRDLFSDDINAEQDRVFMILQELVRDADRSHKAPLGGVGGEFTVQDIEDAEENAAAAEAAAAAAGASEAAAAASAAEAAAAVAKSVRVDQVQAFTQPEKDQGIENLGLGAKFLPITSDPIKDFMRLGMVPNSAGAAASNAVLLNTALGEIPASFGGGLNINFGNFYIADISPMPVNRPLSVRGQGRGVSIVTPTQTAGTFMEFGQTDYTDTVHFSDFTMQFETAALCKAMLITYPAADATNNQMPHRVSGVNVDIRGFDAALHGPVGGIELVNVTGADFARVNVGGRQNNSLPAGEQRFTSMAYGWLLRAPDGGTPTILKWNQCKVFTGQNQWDVRDLHEGLHWNDCEAVAGLRGIKILLAAQRPGFYINNMHLASFRECLNFDGASQAQIKGLHAYIREDALQSDVGPGVTAKCILLNNSIDSIIEAPILVSLAPTGSGGANATGVQLGNSNRTQIIRPNMGGLMEGVRVGGTSAGNVYQAGLWHDAQGTGTIQEYFVTSGGAGNVRRGQELLSSSNRNTVAVTVTGGAAAVTVTSTATDTLEANDRLRVDASLLVNKDAAEGNIRAILNKSGTSVVVFENNLLQLDVEQQCAANGQARIRVSGEGRVTTRGSATFALQVFGPVSGGTVPIDGGQIQITRL